MNKLKTGKGALKDYNRYLYDEYNDYAEQPEYYDPVLHLTDSNGLQINTASKKLGTGNLPSKMPKCKPNFNIVTASGGLFEGPFGRKLAMLLGVSDVLRLLRTCRYFYRCFLNGSIWKDFLSRSYREFYLSNDQLSSINIMQYAKHLRCSVNGSISQSHEQKKNHDGIVFDTLVIERDMKVKEDKTLVRNIVDFVAAKHPKTIDTINKIARLGTFTKDLKISWVKELNQVCVWVAGYHLQNHGLVTFACILFNKEYEGDSQLVKKAYFLNDRYFVVEIEETNEKDGVSRRALEVYAVEPEHDWFEKRHISLCKQVLKESFNVGVENVRVRNVGDFIAVLFEREERKLCVQAFDVKNGGQCLHRSEDLQLEAKLDDVMASRSVTKDAFSLYVIDKESEIYVVDYSIESGVKMKRINRPEKIKEKEDEESKMRFSNTIKKYHYEVHLKLNKKHQSKTFEFLMVYNEKKFYFVNFQSNELVDCDLPGYDVNSKLFNWTIYGEYLYLLIGTTIKIYQLDLLNYSAVPHRKDLTTGEKFKGSSARWILVNPCFIIIMSASFLDEELMGSLQMWVGSTQNLLVKKGLFDYTWYFDKCRLDNILGKIDKWQEIGFHEKEMVECKFEDERLLIQTNLRGYFRDFNVCERRVERKLYEWKTGVAVYDLSEPEVGIPLKGFSSGHSQVNKTKLVTNLAVRENRNGKMKKQGGNQKWKSVEKKAETEEKLEKKENKKKGDKYYKNVRQGKHRGKMSDLY